jgi:hypothetical protein
MGAFYTQEMAYFQWQGKLIENKVMLFSMTKKKQPKIRLCYF